MLPGYKNGGFKSRFSVSMSDVKQCKQPFYVKRYYLEPRRFYMNWISFTDSLKYLPNSRSVYDKDHYIYIDIKPAELLLQGLKCNNCAFSECERVRQDRRQINIEFSE